MKIIKIMIISRKLMKIVGLLIDNQKYLKKIREKKIKIIIKKKKKKK